MSLFTPEIAEYALRLREAFPARAPEEEVLVDTMVSAAIRLKILYNDPRALDPFDPLWTRTHTATLRAFFRAHDTLTRRRRTPGSQPNRPEPPPPDPSPESRTKRASTPEINGHASADLGSQHREHKRLVNSRAHRDSREFPSPGRRPKPPNPEIIAAEHPHRAHLRRPPPPAPPARPA